MFVMLLVISFFFWIWPAIDVFVRFVRTDENKNKRRESSARRCGCWIGLYPGIQYRSISKDRTQRAEGGKTNLCAFRPDWSLLPPNLTATFFFRKDKNSYCERNHSSQSVIFYSYFLGECRTFTRSEVMFHCGVATFTQVKDLSSSTAGIKPTAIRQPAAGLARPTSWNPWQRNYPSLNPKSFVLRAEKSPKNSPAAFINFLTKTLQTLQRLLSKCKEESWAFVHIYLQSLWSDADLTQQKVEFMSFVSE